MKMVGETQEVLITNASFAEWNSQRSERDRIFLHEVLPEFKRLLVSSLPPTEIPRSNSLRNLVQALCNGSAENAQAVELVSSAKAISSKLASPRQLQEQNTGAIAANLLLQAVEPAIDISTEDSFDTLSAKAETKRVNGKTIICKKNGDVEEVDIATKLPGVFVKYFKRGNTMYNISLAPAIDWSKQ